MFYIYTYIYVKYKLYVSYLHKKLRKKNAVKSIITKLLC